MASQLELEIITRTPSKNANRFSQLHYFVVYRHLIGMLGREDNDLTGPDKPTLVLLNASPSDIDLEFLSQILESAKSSGGNYPAADRLFVDREFAANDDFDLVEISELTVPIEFQSMIDAKSFVQWLKDINIFERGYRAALGQSTYSAAVLLSDSSDPYREQV